VLIGRVNINTAPLPVLKTLMDDELAQAVVRYRQGGSVFSSIADLLDITGMTTEKFGELENSVTVRSNVFRILSKAKTSSGMAVQTIECVVDRSQAVPRVLYWLETST
jgi:type II secretory pathway component PulK